MKRVLLGFLVPLERTALLVLLDRPAVGDEWVGIAVDDVFDDSDGSLSAQDTTYFGENLALAETLDVVIVEVRAAEGQLEFVGLANIEHEIAHRFPPCDDVHY